VNSQIILNERCNRRPAKFRCSNHGFEPRRKRANDSGYIIVMVAVFLVVMLALVALAVDMGVTYAARTQNQAAADAGALAGAVSFLDTSMPQPATAQTQAVQVAIANKTLGVSVGAGDVTAVGDAVNRRVTVTINRTEPTFFSKVVGFNSFNVRTTAIAEAASRASRDKCTKPWFIPNSLGTTAPCGPMGACNTGKVLLAGSPPQVTAYAAGLMQSPPIPENNEFVMKPQSPGGAISPSDFYVIDIGGAGGGAAQYQAAVESCVEDAETLCQGPYQVKTGNMVGPTKDGINNLIGLPPDDTYISIDHYHHSDGNIYSTSRALITAPIVDLCGYTGFCPSGGLPSGVNVYLNVIGFAKIFVESVGQNGPNRGDVLARIVAVYPCGSGATPDTTGSEVFGVPLRLVRAP
jgi:Putative Flp pilus-assembly TadE/G-like